jgi:hypothetical protein
MPSTVIKQFSYKPDAAILTVTFLSGNVYAYKNVPEKVYRSLKTAGSKGRYFNKFIRDIFEFEHLE